VKGSSPLEASAVDLASHRLETLLEDGEFALCRNGHTNVPARSSLVVMPRSEHARPQVARILEHEAPDGPLKASGPVAVQVLIWTMRPRD